MSDREQTTDDEAEAQRRFEDGVPTPVAPTPKSSRDEWLGALQYLLEAAKDSAPDETCRTLASNLCDQTAELTDD